MVRGGGGRGRGEGDPVQDHHATDFRRPTSATSTTPSPEGRPPPPPFYPECDDGAASRRLHVLPQKFPFQTMERHRSHSLQHQGFPGVQLLLRRRRRSTPRSTWKSSPADGGSSEGHRGSVGTDDCMKNSCGQEVRGGMERQEVGAARVEDLEAARAEELAAGTGLGPGVGMMKGDDVDESTIGGKVADVEKGDEEEDWDQYEQGHDLEGAFENLNLQGEEEEDLDLSGEFEDLIKDVRWMALFRVHTLRPFSHASLLNSMRNAWACAQGVTFNIKGPNLFLAQCHCLGDWKRVMEGGPWQFRRDPVVLVEYDGFSDVEEYELNMYPLWARIKGLPDGLTRKKELAEKVAKKVGEPPFTVTVNEGRINPSNFLRVRVFVNVTKPLVRFVHITLKERKRYSVFYEKLPDFCFFCGRMGHVVEECGDGVHDTTLCEWGEWLHWVSEPVGSGG